MPFCLISSPPGQNRHHFTHDIFICVFVKEKLCTLNKISLKFVSKSPTDNNPALVKIMTWWWIGNNPHISCLKQIIYCRLFCLILGLHGRDSRWHHREIWMGTMVSACKSIPVTYFSHYSQSIVALEHIPQANNVLINYVPELLLIYHILRHISHMQALCKGYQPYC